MISLQRSADRRYVRDGAMRMWQTFYPANPAHSSQQGFRSLESLNEVSLPLGTGFKLDLDGDHQVVTYVREGGLQVQDTPQGDELLGPGWYQCANSHPWTVARVPRGSRSRSTRLFICSIRVHPPEPERSCEYHYVPFAHRNGHLRLIASPSGEPSSLHLQMNIRMYSSLFEKGQHVVHELREGRGAWLHVVAGRVQVLAQTLEAGDGASFEDEAALSFSAQEASEVLLFDLA